MRAAAQTFTKRNSPHFITPSDTCVEFKKNDPSKPRKFSMISSISDVSACVFYMKPNQLFNRKSSILQTIIYNTLLFSQTITFREEDIQSKMLSR